MISQVTMRLISFFIICNFAKFVCSDQREDIISETVVIKSSSNIKQIEVPTSDRPILIWMDVRKGIFPKITHDWASTMNVAVGDPITLFVFYKDNGSLYDVRVTDCWAYDDENFPVSKQKLHLSGTSAESANKELSKWKKFRSRKSPSFLYASFASFKFPEKDKVFLTCDVQLIGREQS